MKSGFCFSCFFLDGIRSDDVCQNGALLLLFVRDGAGGIAAIRSARIVHNDRVSSAVADLGFRTLKKSVRRRRCAELRHRSDTTVPGGGGGERREKEEEKEEDEEEDEEDDRGKTRSRPLLLDYRGDP